ncbi:MAG: hypothetical protein H0T05_00015 [Acidobacteria bacterium]|nr:hypothetical protein [Acidobacteriota bacterium]
MPARIDLRRTDDRWPFAQGADSSRWTRASPATANSGGARAGLLLFGYGRAEAEEKAWKALERHDLDGGAA